MFKRIHFIGIKGVGMSALAQLFRQQGAIVTGSDTAEEFPTDKNLKKIGIFPALFSGENINKNLDCVIYSRAYKEDHPEIKKARELGIVLMDYGEALAYFFNQKKGIVITGTHGKTTTAAMTAKIFEDAGLDPVAVIGGEVLSWQSNARCGNGEYFIAEGDEYQEKFLYLNPHAVLITNIEYDHPDFFPDFQSYKNAFGKLVRKIQPSGFCVIPGEDKNAVEVADNFGGKKIIFSPALQPDVFNKLKLRVSGFHNRMNALAAFLLAQEFGIPQESIFKSLAEFQGVKRRLEHYNNSKSRILVIDDYAHHPTEIKASLSALSEAYPDRKIIVAFQPHTFSRTEALFDEFEKAFDDAHMILIADIYASAREKVGKINSLSLAEGLSKRGLTAFYAPTLSGICEFFQKFAASSKKNDKYIFLTMGAGDIWKVAREIKNKLQK